MKPPEIVFGVARGDGEAEVSNSFIRKGKTSNYLYFVSSSISASMIVPNWVDSPSKISTSTSFPELFFALLLLIAVGVFPTLATLKSKGSGFGTAPSRGRAASSTFL